MHLAMRKVHLNTPKNTKVDISQNRVHRFLNEFFYHVESKKPQKSMGALFDIFNISGRKSDQNIIFC